MKRKQKRAEAEAKAEGRQRRQQNLEEHAHPRLSPSYCPLGARLFCYPAPYLVRTRRPLTADCQQACSGRGPLQPRERCTAHDRDPRPETSPPRVLNPLGRYLAGEAGAPRAGYPVGGTCRHTVRIPQALCCAFIPRRR